MGIVIQGGYNFICVELGFIFLLWINWSLVLVGLGLDFMFVFEN